MPAEKLKVSVRMIREEGFQMASLYCWLLVSCRFPDAGFVAGYFDRRRHSEEISEEDALRYIKLVNDYQVHELKRHHAD